MLNRECQGLFARLLSLSLVLGLCLLIGACGYSTDAFLAKGEEYLAKRKFHDALMQFRTAAESDPFSARAHWGLARTYENLGQFNEVMDELRKAVELEETNLEAKAKLGSYFLLVQPPLVSEAEKLRNEILAANPKFIEGHILSASILAAQKRPDSEVVDAVNKAIDMDPQRIESYISLQRLYMTRENADEAEKAIRRGIAANPAATLGYIEYGRFLMYASRDAEAEVVFSQAISNDPTNIEAREAAADFYVTSRQTEKAERAYLDLVTVQENSPESRLVLAEFYETAERGDEAVNVLNSIIADTPEYVRARYKLGEIYLDRKDASKVNEQLEALFNINDNDTEALMLRSRLRLQENKPDEAVKDLEDVLKKTPSAKEPLFLMVQARLALGQVEQANAFIGDLDRYHPSYIKTGLLKIQSAFTAGDAGTAFKLSNELVDRVNAAMPNAEFDPQALADIRIRGISSRGLANLDLGKLAEAKGDLQEVVRVSPKSGAALVNLAKVFIAQRDHEGARELYEKALNLDAANFDAINGIVNAFVKLGQPARAHQRIEELIARNAGQADMSAALHYLRSTVFSAEKNAVMAERELTTAIELDPTYLPAYSAYANLLIGQNRTDEALVQYNRALEKRPTAQVYTLIGMLEDSRGNRGEAEKAYRKALELAPETAIAANNLAWLIADTQGNLDEALQLATMAVSKNQSVPGYYDTLGWVYLKKGLTSTAVGHLRKAVAIEEANARKAGTAPNPGYRERLGMALARAGDKSLARL
jgi:tetratricopeptide (TPR) repeat protein